MTERTRGAWQHPPVLFFCAICGFDVRDYYHGAGHLSPIAPVCRSCEQHYGTKVGSPGTFRDRRVAAQISALAVALHGEASAQKWRHHAA